MIHALIVVGVYLGLIALLVWVHNRYKRRRRLLYERSEDHTAMVNALTDWLQSPKIVRVMVETGTATVAELQLTMAGLHTMTEAQVKEAMVALLRNKNVRRVVAVHIARDPRAGITHEQAMRGLRRYAEVA